MRGRQLRELRDGLIRELDLDRSATTETVCIRLCEVVADRLQRTIYLRFQPLGDVLSGVSAKGQDGSYTVLVTTARSWTHRVLILLHELAHMLCGHQHIVLNSQEADQLLRPDLSAEMLTVIAQRTVWSDADEHEAEHVAGVLMQSLLDWAHQQDIQPFRPADDDRVAGV
ncbi:hypothetical protein [Crossiella sp. CA198]|uniref:hypothetical protein n=1 Tax=Crossiella sp. CA198 TaxID=3455607 RepID=UPI003F8D39C1